MRGRSWPLRVVLVVVGVVLAAGVAVGEVGVDARFTGGGRAVVGERVELVVAVSYRDEGLDPSVRLPDVPEGVVVESLGTRDSVESRFHFSGGEARTSKRLTRVLRFSVRASSAGLVEIPSMEVEGGDGRGLGVFTEPLLLRVDEVGERDDVRLVLEVADDELWVGERTTVRLTLMFEEGSMVRDFSFLETGFGGGLLEAAGGVSGGSPRPATVPRFLGEPARFADRGVVEEGGVRFRTYGLVREVEAGRVGEGEVGPVVVMTEFQPRGFRRASRVGVRSEAVAVAVRALPREGRPEGFGGLVGSYEVSSSVSDRSVRVGDPLTFRVTVRGSAGVSGGVQGMAAPAVWDMPGFGEGFRVRLVDEPAVRGRDGGGETVTFEYVLRATEAGVAEVPGVELWFFDPDLGEYRAARSEAIPISVEAGSRVTLGGAEGDRAGAAVERGVVVLGDALEDVPELYGVGAVVVDEDFDVGAVVRTPWVAVLIAGPPLAYGLALMGVVVSRRRRARGGVRGIGGSVRSALAAMDAVDGGEAERARAGLVAYAAARRGMESASVTVRDGAEVMAMDRRGLGDRASAVVDRVEAARYGGTGAGGSLEAEARALLEEVNRAGRGGAGGGVR